MPPSHAPSAPITIVPYPDVVPDSSSNKTSPIPWVTMVNWPALGDEPVSRAMTIFTEHLTPSGPFSDDSVPPVYRICYADPSDDWSCAVIPWETVVRTEPLELVDPDDYWTVVQPVTELGRSASDSNPPDSDPCPCQSPGERPTKMTDHPNLPYPLSPDITQTPPYFGSEGNTYDTWETSGN